MTHKKGPWSLIKPGHLHAASTDFLCVEIDAEDNYSTSELMPDDARVIVASVNSYDRHCGENAVQMAEADLLGQLIEFCQLLPLHLVENENLDAADIKDNSQRIIGAMRHLKGILAKLKGKINDPR